MVRPPGAVAAGASPGVRPTAPDHAPAAQVSDAHRARPKPGRLPTMQPAPVPVADRPPRGYAASPERRAPHRDGWSARPAGSPKRDQPSPATSTTPETAPPATPG